MKTIIVSFESTESEIAHSRLDDLVQHIRKGHKEARFKSWGHTGSGYVAKISLRNDLPLGEFKKACEQCGIENGTLNLVH